MADINFVRYCIKSMDSPYSDLGSAKVSSWLACNQYCQQWPGAIGIAFAVVNGALDTNANPHNCWCKSAFNQFISDSTRMLCSHNAQYVQANMNHFPNCYTQLVDSWYSDISSTYVTSFFDCDSYCFNYANTVAIVLAVTSFATIDLGSPTNCWCKSSITNYNMNNFGIRQICASNGVVDYLFTSLCSTSVSGLTCSCDNGYVSGSDCYLPWNGQPALSNGMRFIFRNEFMYNYQSTVSAYESFLSKGTNFFGLGELVYVQSSTVDIIMTVSGVSGNTGNFFWPDGQPVYWDSFRSYNIPLNMLLITPTNDANYPSTYYLRTYGDGINAPWSGRLFYQQGVPLEADPNDGYGKDQKLFYYTLLYKS